MARWLPLGGAARRLRGLYRRCCPPAPPRVPLPPHTAVLWCRVGWGEGGRRRARLPQSEGGGWQFWGAGRAMAAHVCPVSAELWWFLQR